MRTVVRALALCAAAISLACSGGSGRDQPGRRATVDAARSSLTASPSSRVVANGSAAATVIATARDASGSAIAGSVAVFAVAGLDADFSSSTATTGPDGSASVTLTALHKGAKVVSVVVDGVPVTQQATVEFISPAPSATGALKVSVDAPAVQLQPSLAYDASGNAVAVWIEDIGGGTARMLWARYTAGTTSWSDAAELVPFLNGAPAQAVVASNGTGFMVLYQIGSAVRALPSSGTGWGTAVTLTTGQTLSPVALASNGNGYAAVWSEGSGGPRSIFANVFDGTSWKNDAGGNPVSTLLEGASGDATTPVVASDGAGYATAWLQYDGTTTSVFASTWNGTSWSATPALLETSDGYAQMPSIAGNSTGYAVAWAQTDTLNQNYRVYANLFNGSWQGATLLESTTEYCFHPVVVAKPGGGGNSFAVVWNAGWSNGQIRAAVRQAGTWQAALVAAGAQAQMPPAAVFDGSAFRAAWTVDGQQQLRSSAWGGTAWQASERLDAATGTVGVPAALAPAGASVAAIFPQKDASGASRILVATRNSSWSTPVDLLKTTFRKSTDSFGQLATNDRGETLAVWQTYRSGFPQVMGRVNRDGLWEDPVLIGMGEQPSMATDGSGFLVAWVSATDWGVHARRWSDGWGAEAVLSPPSGGDQPVVASDGTGYAVAYASYSNGWTIQLARFDGAAWVDDGAGGVAALRVDADGSALTPRIGSNGSGYCVAWLSSASFPQRVLARVLEGSAWVGPPEPLHDSTATPAQAPVLASDGAGYGVAMSLWTAGTSHVYVNRFVGSSWQTSGPSPDPTLVETFVESSGFASLASNGTGYAVAWRQESPGGSSSFAVAAVFDGNAWQPPSVLSPASWGVGEVRIGSDGLGYAASWGDVSVPAVYLDRWAAGSWLVDGGGAPAPITIDSGGGKGGSPNQVVSNGNGYAVVWDQPDDLPTYWDTPEIWARLGL
jgi:hypothetical protein